MRLVAHAAVGYTMYVMTFKVNGEIRIPCPRKHKVTYFFQKIFRGKNFDFQLKSKTKIGAPINCILLTLSCMGDFQKNTFFSTFLLSSRAVYSANS